VKTSSTDRTSPRQRAVESRRRSRRRPRSTGGDALAVLAADRDAIDALMQRVRTARLDARRRHALVLEFCTAQRIHMMLEEEILCPVVRRAAGDAACLHEFRAQQDAIKPLLAQLASLRPGDRQYEPCLNVLHDYVRLHSDQEAEELFPVARACGINLRGLGDQLRARKRALDSAVVVLGEVLTTSR
jgi:hypothetical protein